MPSVSTTVTLPYKPGGPGVVLAPSPTTSVVVANTFDPAGGDAAILAQLGTLAPLASPAFTGSPTLNGSPLTGGGGGVSFGTDSSGFDTVTISDGSSASFGTDSSGFDTISI